MKRKSIQRQTETTGRSQEAPLIVQFFHSGKEFHVRGGVSGEPVEVPWKLERKVSDKAIKSAGCTGRPPKKKQVGCGGCSDNAKEERWTADHSRRLVVHKGKYIDDDGKRISGDLAFWTEWEACSIAYAMPKGAQSTDARWFHRVVTPLGNAGEHRINTDPCVFGSSFKYALCQQHMNGETNDVLLRHLAPGSIILFGSRFVNRQEFVLDTVFVVGSVRACYGEKTKNNLEVSDEYRELTLNRFSNGFLKNTFYRGATFISSAGAKPYSFVPAKPFVPGDSRCGKRFVLDLAALNRHLRGTSEQFNPESGKTQGFYAIKGTPEISRSVWQEIVRQVRAAGFVPGTSFDWPR